MADSNSGGAPSPKNDLSGVSTSESNSVHDEPKPYISQENPQQNGAPRRRARRTSVVSSMAPDVDGELKQPLWKSIWEMVRPGWLMNNLTYNGFKVIVRTWIAIWVGFVLADVPSSAIWIGQATYLTSIVAAIIGPGGHPYIIALVINLSALVFVLVGWVHAIIASAITTSIRGNPTQIDAVEQLIAAGVCQNNAELERCVTLNIFSGYFLEFRCSVIFILALLIGVTIMSLFRRLSPVMILAHINGIISIVINCCYGVLFPYFSGKAIGVSIWYSPPFEWL
jgi:hypothetical protein